MLEVSYTLFGAHKVQDFKNRKTFEKFCFEVNPLDDPHIMEILEVSKIYYYIDFDNEVNGILDYTSVFLKDSEVNRIGNALEWKGNRLFKSEKKIKKFFIENNL